MCGSWSRSTVRRPVAALRDGGARGGDPSGEPFWDRTGLRLLRANTKGHRALLLINPHTSFFFRSELQMVSEQGLNAYWRGDVGDSSSFIKGSTTRPVGCTPPAAWMRWMNTWRRWS